jgi:alpha-tubulin suppressor-like RCC1 family protein
LGIFSDLQEKYVLLFIYIITGVSFMKQKFFAVMTMIVLIFMIFSGCSMPSEQQTSSGPIKIQGNTNRSAAVLAGVIDEPIKALNSGNGFNFLITESGKLYCTGYNEHGQLGLGDNTDRRSWTLNSLTDVKAVSCGYYHTLALTNNGDLYVTGDNSSRQCGVDTFTSTNIWVRIGPNAKSIACGLNSSFVIVSDGTLYAAGYNGYGQLGLSTSSTSYNWTVTKTDIKEISTSGYHSIAVTSDGTCYGSGLNNYNQFGVATAIQSGNPWTICGGPGVVKVACGSDGNNGFSLALCSNGDLYNAGINDRGQLANGVVTNVPNTWHKMLDGVKDIACGINYCFAVKSNGDLYGVGDNSFGKLGFYNNKDIETPWVLCGKDVKLIAAGDRSSITYCNNGILYGSGINVGRFGNGSDVGAKQWTPVLMYGPKPVPLYRYWNQSWTDHFYTTNVDEDQTVKSYGYTYEGIQCYVYNTQVPGTVPLYRYWSTKIYDHYYTIYANDPVVTSNGYYSEGTAGYVYETPVPGSMPLYSYSNNQITDHFYTTNSDEIGTIIINAIGKYGYYYDGIRCYVMPNQ